MTTEQPDLRFLLTFKREDSYDHPLLTSTAYVVRIELEGGVERVRNLDATSSYTGEPDLSLADLSVTAQCDGITTADGSFYGWSTTYRNAFSVNLERAEAMAKTLRKVRRELARLENELSYPASYGAYLARVAKILGIHQYGWSPNADTGWHDRNEYHWTDSAGSMHSTIETEAHKFNKQRVG